MPVDRGKKTSEQYSSSMIPAPRLSSVSLAMLIDHLRECEILHSPASIPRPLKWFAILKNKSEFNSLSFEENTLVVCREKTALALVDENPATTFLVLTGSEQAPNWINEAGRHSRVILVKASHSFSYYERIVQRLFVDELIWENNMDYIVYSKGRLDRLIDESISRLDSFICITDTGYNLITHSKDVAPPNAVYEHLLGNNSYDSIEIESLVNDVLSGARPRDNLIVRMSNDHNQNVTIHSPIFIDSAYVFHITLVYNGNCSLEATCDLFKRFVARATLICNEFWANKIVLESPCHKMLIHLINNRKLHREYIEAQLEIANIPKNSRFRLLCYRLDPKQTHLTNSTIVKTAEKLNDGSCHPFTYENNLLILCYAPLKDEAAISLNKIHKSVANEMYDRFDLSAGSSQIFTDIKDISFAFKQTATALRMRQLLKQAYPEGYLGDGSYPLYPFEYVLSFILLETNRDEELIKHSFSGSILQKLLEEDRAAHTDLVSLLWNYICTERNASDTSTRIHTHRNTVVYHIKKLAKRFDIPFDSPMVRNRIILDYHYHVLTSVDI